VDLVGLGPVQHLLEDPSVSDVLVNGPGPVWVERAGRLERTTTVVDRSQVLTAIERLVVPLGLRVDRSQPVLDARLADGTRVCVVLDPPAVGGPFLAVRRHGRATPPLEQVAAGFAAALRDRLHRRRNIVVHGPTGSGKTTLLNALAAELRPDERIVTIEDVAELRLPGDHVVRLEARPGTAEGVGRVGIRQLVRTALRLRPDRLVVGEVRGAEALDMVWALSTGHDGSMSTLHASSAPDALRRLATMCLAADEALPLAAVREQVADAVHVLVGMSRTDGGGRRVTSLHDVVDGVPVPGQAS
jgi:pilus assembly protein CpaF